MKFTIHGFSQARALEFRKEIEKNGKKTIIKLDDTDLLLLRWFVDFFPRMSKLYIDKKEFAWVNYATVINDLPLLELEKKSIYLRFKKMSDFGILEHKHIKDSGSYSYYGFGYNYGLLIDTEYDSNLKSEAMTSNSEGRKKNSEGGSKKITEGVVKKLPNKDSSIKYNSSIIFNSNIYNEHSDKIENAQDTFPIGIEENKKSSFEEKEQSQLKNNSTKSKKNQVKHKYGEYNNVLLSDTEYEKLKEEFPNDYQERIDKLSEYIASTGKKYKNFLATIRSWAKRDKANAKVPDKYSVNKDYSGGWD